MASNIRYLSTRGESTGASYDEIVLRGLASDGGLFMPESYPQVTAEALESWRKLPYADLAFEVLRLFASGIDEAALKEICRSTYTEKTYCNAREGDDPKDITPVRWLEDGIGLLELSNGPTLAFKDMAMQYLGALFEHLLAREGKTLNILGATSGDTGSAAEYAMRGRKGIRVFMLSPYGRMSDFQRAQMYSLEDPNIFNIAVRGTFDQAQDIVKAVSNDHAFKSAHSIGTVNSINWARVAAQVVYYFKGWLAAAEKGEAISFAVPSGNFGDVLAGWIAKQMGLPIASLIVATNENDVLTEFFETGVYHPRDAAHTYVTSSPSMDISRASNFERFIFDIVGRDPEVLKRLWHVMATEGEFRLTGELWERVLASVFTAGKSTHADRLATIRDTWERLGVMIDPHTADGLKVAREKRLPGVKCLCLETAQAAKFSKTIIEATGTVPAISASCADLLSLPQHCEVMDPETEDVKQFIDRHTKE